jgi:hypothetical protein
MEENSSLYSELAEPYDRARRAIDEVRTFDDYKFIRPPSRSR